MVATAEGYQGRGYAKKLVKQFLEAANDAQLDAVHLYAVSTNTKAVSMYYQLGFEEWKLSDEPRPDDLHLIYYFRNKKNQIQKKTAAFRIPWSVTGTICKDGCTPAMTSKSIE